MKHLPGPHNKMFSHFNDILDFISQEVQRHKQDLDHSNPRDYIDSFLIEMENVCEQHALHIECCTAQLYSHSLLCLLCILEQRKESDLGFNEINLTMCSVDLFLAGTETTSTTLQWALVYLIKNPDIQGR